MKQGRNDESKELVK